VLGQRPQQVFLVPLLVGTDGLKKMSKSLENYIGVDEPPQQMFGKVMSIPDPLILQYFELLTDVPDEEMLELKRAMESGGVNPMELKKRLAREIVSRFHSPEAGAEAELAFERVFQRRELPEEISEFVLPRENVPLGMASLIVQAGLASSRSEAKRLIIQGAVELDGHRVTNDSWPFHEGSVLRVGKRRFVRLRFPPD